MRFIIGFLVGCAVIIGVYSFAPLERMRSQAKDAIDQVSKNSPSLNLKEIKSEITSIMDEPTGVFGVVKKNPDEQNKPVIAPEEGVTGIDEQEVNTPPEIVPQIKPAENISPTQTEVEKQVPSAQQQEHQQLEVSEKQAEIPKNQLPDSSQNTDATIIIRKLQGDRRDMP